MDIKTLKERFAESYNPEFKGRVAVTDMLSKKDRRIFDMPTALTNCEWLLFSDFVPENLKKQVLKLADAVGDSDRYADRVADTLATAKDEAKPAAVIGYAIFEEKPIALLLTSDGDFLAVNAKWLTFFKRVGSDSLFINRNQKSCLCVSKDGKDVGIIMGINTKLEN